LKTNKIKEKYKYDRKFWPVFPLKKPGYSLTGRPEDRPCLLVWSCSAQLAAAGED
jgi:hypothetical protein